MKTRKLKCIVTGKILFATSDYYDRKLDRCDGDVDKLHNTYVCKEAKNLLKQGYLVDNIRDMLNIKDETLGIVGEDTIKDIINTGKPYLRGITSDQVPGLVNNVVHKTDPDVKVFLERITSKN
tara:strand:- start:3583 stop:3951 length:369 start_codon:yes stop_codon:yes gene_type:complete